MRSEKEEILWTVPHVARFLRVTEKTVYRLVQRGKIPSFKLGWMWRFREAEIRQWLESQRVARHLLTSPTDETEDKTR